MIESDRGKVSTRDALVGTARQLFAKQGFRGTSVRAITEGAAANLGAVTYHFGSKRDLYHEVIDRATAPIRERLGATRSTGTALDGITAVLRTMFAFLAESPDLPALVMQQLVTSDPLPPAARDTLTLVVERIASLIEQGQRDRSIRTGPPPLMAVSFALLPMAHAIYRRALHDVLGLDQTQPSARDQLQHEVVTLVRRGLAAHRVEEGGNT